MVNGFLKSLSNLISVKSIVDYIILTFVFAHMCVTNQVNSEFVTIYAMIITFYFSTTKVANNKEIGEELNIKKIT